MAGRGREGGREGGREEGRKVGRASTLSYRRKRGDMIEVYKYTHGLYKVSALSVVSVEVEEKTTRGHNYKLKKKL